MVPVKKKLLQMYKTMVAIRGFEESLAEVVDLRTLSPLDHETLSASVQKTHKTVVIQEACEMAGVAAQVVKSLMHNCFDHLDAPVKTIAALDTVIPLSPPLEDLTLPSEQKIVATVKALMA